MDAAEVLAGVTEALRALLPEQRWFAGKDRPVLGISALQATDLGGPQGGGAHSSGPHSSGPHSSGPHSSGHQRGGTGSGDTGPRLVHGVVEIDHGVRRDRYQLLLGVRRELPENLAHAWIGTVSGEVVYFAQHDPDLTPRLLALMAEQARVGSLRFDTEPGVSLDTGLRSRPVGAEQSNTSLVYEQTYILKLFRRLGTGYSPDLELHRALARVGSTHIATPLGSIEGELSGTDGEPPGVVTYGMLTEFLRGTADGWAMATASVRDLLAENLLTEGAPGQGDGHVRPEDVGGDFASEAHRLGTAVAEVHADLATALGSEPAPPAYLGELVAGMHRRLDGALAAVPGLAEHEPALRAAFDAVLEVTGPVRLQRIHGDLHLGQVLRSLTGWVLIDFEGEPARPLAERIAPSSALRDVAGMLRSFDYAANHLPMSDTELSQQSEAALAWARRNQAAFCDGYAEAGADPREQPVLLRAFMLDKAVYEAGYEHAHRPAWLPIPMEAIARISAATGETTGTGRA